MNDYFLVAFRAVSHCRFHCTKSQPFSLGSWHAWIGVGVIVMDWLTFMLAASGGNKMPCHRAGVLLVLFPDAFFLWPPTVGINQNYCHNHKAKHEQGLHQILMTSASHGSCCLWPCRAAGDVKAFPLSVVTVPHGEQDLTFIHVPLPFILADYVIATTRSSLVCSK